MSLQEQQNFLARLFTDDGLRRAFLSDPAKIGKENKLNERETAEIAEIVPAELNFFADSLFWKRLREVEKFLPRSRKVLGRDFEKYFRQFAQNFNPRSIKKHFEDAREFAGFLSKREIEPVWCRDLIKYERSRLIFHGDLKKIVIQIFAFDIREILHDTAKNNAADFLEIPKRKTLAIWLRFQKKSKFFIF